MPHKLPVFRPPHLGPVQTRRDIRATYDERRAQDATLSRIVSFRGSVAWQKVRRSYLQRHPVCEDPFKQHRFEVVGVSAEAVHHVIPLIDDLTLGLTDANLRSLCWFCHNRVEALARTDLQASIRLFLTHEQELVLRSTPRLGHGGRVEAKGVGFPTDRAPRQRVPHDG